MAKDLKVILENTKVTIPFPEGTVTVQYSQIEEGEIKEQIRQALSGIDMPGMDGAEIVVKLKRFKNTSSEPQKPAGGMTLREFIDMRFHGKITMFARAFGISRMTAYDILNKGFKRDTALRRKLEREGVRF